MTPDGRLARRPGEGGFTLAMFVMVVAIVSIMLAVAVQSVEFSMRREREAELIFRGQQYVEAIRLYKMKYGRYPMRMKEIWEAKPRVVRKKWKDPITDSESWGLIFVGQDSVGGLRGGRPGAGGALPVQTPGAGGLFEDDRAERDGVDAGDDADATGRGSGRRERLPPGVQRSSEGELIGPIMGVRSTSCDESIKIYEGRTAYCEWQFVFREDERLQRGGGGRPGGGIHGGNYPTPVPTSGPGGGGDDRDDGGGSPDYGVTPTR